MYFDLSKTRIYRAIQLEKIFSTKAVYRTVSLLFILLVLVMLVLFFSPEVLGGQRIFGLFLIITTITFGFWIYSLFFTTYLQSLEKKQIDKDNLAGYLDFRAAQIMDEFLRGGKNDISEVLFPLFKIPGSEFILYRIGVHPDNFRENLKQYLTHQGGGIHSVVSIEKTVVFLEDALESAENSRGEKVISWRDLLVVLSVHSEFFRKFLFSERLTKKDILALTGWQRSLEQAIDNSKRFWRKENLMATKGVAKGWSAGYTARLDRYATDVTRQIAKHGFSAKLYGRKAETETIERILARAGQNNVVVVGEPGVGKKTAILALAHKILEGQTLPALSHKRVLELDVGAVLAGTTSVNQVAGRLKDVLNDAAKAGNVILLIDEIHTLFSRELGAGEINATELFIPYLGLTDFQIIGLTDHENYNRTIGRNPSLLKSFSKVEINEPDKATTFKILQDVVPAIEKHSQVIVLYQTMKELVELTDRYIKDVPFPEKAIEVLQEAAVHARAQRKSAVVTPEDVEEVVHQKTEIPVGKIALAEKEVLLDLEKVLHRRVVGQEEAITAVANALRRSRSGISTEKRPIGSFLFLGPTGVGKTETAKTLAAVYFGSEKRMLRFDMSEYQNDDSGKRLIGSGSDLGLLTKAVRKDPFSLLLLDEIEKAHPNILNLFLQVLDDGRLTEASGHTVDFTNTIIIATSNAGSEMIRESVKQFRETNLKERLLDHLQKSGQFRPEFLNRFDALIVYKPLTQEQTEKVAEMLLSALNRRLKEKDIQLKVTRELTKKIAQLGYDPEFGARPLQRVIQDKVENVIAKKLLSGEIKRGDVVEIGAGEL